MTERLTPEERGVLDGARNYFNMMARLIHRAKMARRVIGTGVTLKETASLHDDMQAHRNAVCRLDKGDHLSTEYREDLHDVALILSTDLLSAWRCLVSEAAGTQSFPTPPLKKPTMYEHSASNGWG
ncbi:hypothetical protein [Mesorhizobium australicum]|uniref:Uncharacterized protein n=1 Tax=Mesorhizobium australicum TaxID=536018 RepID=A0A1X7N1B4_9HYPH|nr:hypothetical protein [Mesorhizobium australicum]SMH30162.1 hypothetical protein SAMN02982922_1007 [Mesorhizobium australicum]